MNDNIKAAIDRLELLSLTRGTLLEELAQSSAVGRSVYDLKKILAKIQSIQVKNEKMKELIVQLKRTQQ